MNIDTCLALVLAELAILISYGVWSYRKIRQDERDKKKLARWMAERENRLSRERFWQ